MFVLSHVTENEAQFYWAVLFSQILRETSRQSKEATSLKQAYVDEAVFQAEVFNWYKSFLHGHQTPFHTSIHSTTCEQVSGQKVQSLWHPSSLDHSPCDYFMFPNTETQLHSRHYKSVKNLQKTVSDQVKALKTENFE